MPKFKTWLASLMVGLMGLMGIASTNAGFVADSLETTSSGAVTESTAVLGGTTGDIVIGVVAVMLVAFVLGAIVFIFAKMGIGKKG